jgi:signal recognition particle receptor subunit beta
MVELNHRDRTIKVKIVYYGPPVGGKTTNLQILHHYASARRRGDLISVNSAQDRTILFDLLPLKTAGFRGFDLRLQILAVPGQAMYAATRRLVLKGADSLVFVANSALDRWEENIQSYREMVQNLISHHLDPGQMPLVFQYNKRDLPQVLEEEALDRAVNVRQAPAVPAIAVRGDGVLETFTAILAATVQDLAQRYAVLDVKDSAPAREWAERAVHGLYGTDRLSFPAPPDFLEAPPAPVARPAPPPPVPPAPPPGESPPGRDAVSSGDVPPPQVSQPPASPAPAAAPPASPEPEPAASAPEVSSGHTVVRVAPPPVVDDSPRASPAFPEGRAGELIETYAEASAQLGTALTELRDERDVARQHLADLQQTMQAAQDVLNGTPLEKALPPVLVLMARVAGAEEASFWVPQSGGPPRVAALLNLDDDPVLTSAGALRHVAETVSANPKPALVLASDNLDLGQALDRPGRRLAGLLTVPFRTPGGLQGLAALYYGPDTARPGVSAIEQLTEIPRALSAALELAATLHTVKAAQRALHLALAGTASIRGLEDVVRSLEELRDRLGEIRNRPDAPPWFVDQYVRLAPALGSALEDGRSLLAFGRGELRMDSVYLEDLLAELRTPEVSVEIDPAAEIVSADATLLRVALRAIADEVRAKVGSNTAPLSIHAGAWSDGVRLSVHAPVPPAGGEPRAPLTAGLGLGLARRIAEMHGGALDEGQDGSSDGVVLTLPVA